MMEESCLILVEPCYIPLSCYTVAEAEQRRYKVGEETHGVEIPDEEIRDATWVGESEDQHCWGRKTGSLG